MGELFYDTSNGKAVSAITIMIVGNVARVEVQVVPFGDTVGCGHPAAAARANIIDLATCASTEAAGGEKR